MRLVSAFVLLALASPMAATSLIATRAAAEALGPPTDQFVVGWSTSLTSQFTPWDKPPITRMIAVKAGVIPADAVKEASISAADVDARADLAIEEMANAFEPAQRTALEDLRDAQRAYAAAEGGDRTVRHAQFAGLLHDLVEGRGRSVAHDDAVSADDRLNRALTDATRATSESDRPSLQASETAWSDYRSAFLRFAQAMDRPDAVPSLGDDLARRRTDELRGTAAAAP